jgi:hypothetical protein
MLTCGVLYIEVSKPEKVFENKSFPLCTIACNGLKGNPEALLDVWILARLTEATSRRTRSVSIPAALIADAKAKSISVSLP